MKLGFSVDALLPLARGGGPLRIGLAKLEESEWLEPEPQRPASARQRQERIDREAELHSAAPSTGGMLWPSSRRRSAAHSTTFEPGP